MRLLNDRNEQEELTVIRIGTRKKGQATITIEHTITLIETNPTQVKQVIDKAISQEQENMPHTQ